MRTKKGINDLIKGIMLEGSVNVTNLESTANRIIEALTEENNLIIPDISNCYNLSDMEDAWVADNDMGTFEFWIKSRNN
jgi:hypothetical protein